MNRVVPRALAVLALLLSAVSPPAWGQGAVTVDRLTVVLWPEYDRPSSVLVTYRVQLSPGVALPAVVDLPIPADAGEPHAVAKRAADGRLLLAPAVRSVQGEWAVIQVTTDSPQIHLEYYAPFSTSADERVFTYRWPGGLEIGAFDYEVLAPAGASNVTVTPPPSGHQMTELGVPLHLANLGARTAAQQESIEIRYANPNGQLTVAPAPAPPVSPPPLVSTLDQPPVQAPTTVPAAVPPEQAQTQSPMRRFFPILLGSVIAALVSLWYVRRRSRAGGS